MHLFEDSFYGLARIPKRVMADATIRTRLRVDYGSTASTESDAGKMYKAAEERLKRRIRFFFLNPFQKWSATRRVPWKLSVQIFKIILVTVQVS